jgi:hypothetical protein
MKIVGSSQMYLSIFLSFQIVDYLVVVVGNHSQFLARPHLAATAARLEVLLLCAPSDRAHRAAERRFYALNPAAGAVNHLGQDFGIVQLRPMLGNLLAQLVVVVYGGKSRLAFLAVQTAVCNICLHDYSIRNQIFFSLSSNLPLRQSAYPVTAYPALS